MPTSGLEGGHRIVRHVIGVLNYSTSFEYILGFLFLIPDFSPRVMAYIGDPTAIANANTIMTMLISRFKKF